MKTRILQMIHLFLFLIVKTNIYITQYKIVLNFILQFDCESIMQELTYNVRNAFGYI